MKKVALGLYGAGGYGREVAALIPTIYSELFPNIAASNFLLVFIDDYKKGQEIDDLRVISKSEFLNLNDLDLYYCVTISDCKTRKYIVEGMTGNRSKPLSLIFKDTLVLSPASIGVGTILMPGSKISKSVKIGNHVQINFNSYIAHDCIINDFVTISPSVTCCGNTFIGESAFIGAACVIKQGTKSTPRLIGSESVLGIGSNLICDLPKNEIYIGNPARTIED